jgi:hypothetical protein
MKHALVAYGTVLVVLTMLARRFEAAGWTGVDSLDVAAALVDSLLVLAVAAALLLAGRLALTAWARSMARWRRDRALAETLAVPEAEVVGVTSWRPGAPPPPPPPALAGPLAAPPQTAPVGFTYVGPSYAREVPAAPPFPDRRGLRF